MIRLLALKLSNAAAQALNLILSTLSNGTLGLSIVGALAGELLGREVGDASRRGSSGTTSLWCLFRLLTGSI
jgi:hypothetical protein